VTGGVSPPAIALRIVHASLTPERQNPPGKSDTEYGNEMATCESYSRMHMNDKVRRR